MMFYFLFLGKLSPRASSYCKRATENTPSNILLYLRFIRSPTIKDKTGFSLCNHHDASKHERIWGAVFRERVVVNVSQS